MEKTLEIWNREDPRKKVIEWKKEPCWTNKIRNGSGLRVQDPPQSSYHESAVQDKHTEIQQGSSARNRSASWQKSNETWESKITQKAGSSSYAWEIWGLHKR